MSIGTRTKRSTVPAFWQIPRKRFQFGVTTTSGPHAKSNSIALGVLLRDHMKLFNIMREVQYAINGGKILVDGVPRSSAGFPIGLMDILKILPLEKVYRIVPKDGKPLVPIEIPESESNIKLCKVIAKKTVGKSHIELGLHDGRAILLKETDLSPQDSCLIELPGQKIVEKAKLGEGSSITVIKGRLAGNIAQVKQVLPGSFARRAMVQFTLEDRQVELPVDHVMVVGKGSKPLLTIR